MRLFLSACLSLGLACHAAYAASPEAPLIEDISVDEDGLTIEFDRPMQTWNDNARQTNISIIPEVDCQWTWEEDTTLICDTFDKPAGFKPATYYQVRLGDGFLSQEGIAFNAKTIKANTPGPNISARILEWNNTLPVIEIESSLQLDAGTIEKYLTVSINGKKLFYQLDIRETGHDGQTEYKRVKYLLKLNEITQADALLKISVKPGLKSPVGSVPGDQEETILNAKINETFQMTSLSCFSGKEKKEVEVIVEKLKSVPIACNPESYISIMLSQALSEEGVASLSALLPEGFIIKKPEKSPYYYYYHDPKRTANAPRRVYLLKSDYADTRLMFKFPAGMRGTSGAPLKQAPEIVINIGDYATKFTLKTSDWTLLPGQDSGVKLEVLNSPINADRIGQLQISTVSNEKIVSLPLVGEKNKISSIELPQVEKNIQKNGGISLFGSEGIRGVSGGVAYVPFNVLSYQSSDQVIVWATQWQSGAVISNAVVDILRLDANRKLHKIATARTGKEGVAKLDLTFSSIQQNDLMSFVRVTSEGKTVVSPALTKSTTKLNFEKDYSAWQYYATKPSKLMSFGVSELPLYRPGENVKYRVWLREKLFNHLRIRAAGNTTNLQLIDINNEKILQTWAVKLDANASIAASIVLSRLLPDGYYCISSEESDQDRSGACFQVARFDAQPLWATMTADKSSVLFGDSINFQVQSGYFSGGPASNIELKFSALSTPRRLEYQYPEFREFTFINSLVNESVSDGGDPLKDIAVPLKTDGKGEAGFKLSLDKPVMSGADEDPPIAFGVLEFSAEVKIAGKASASSSNVAINYARFPRYVGLKTKDWWLPIDKDPALKAVVITYDGKEVANQSVLVSIYEYRDKNKINNNQQAQIPVAQCHIISGQVSPCAFRAIASGRYLFRAESEGAAGAELVRYVGESYRAENTDTKPKASLALVQASDGNSPARVLLDQPFENATALFTLEYDHIVRHWVQHLNNKQTEIAIPVKQDWAPGLSLRAVIRPAKNSSALAGKKAETLDALLDIDIPPMKTDGLQLNASKAEYRPGEEVEITISNLSTKPNFATMSVIDDSVYQQASEVWNFQDPNNDNWLGELKNWQVSSWYGIEAWRSVPNIFFNEIKKANGAKKPGSDSTAVANRGRSFDRSGFAEVDSMVYSDDGSMRLETVQVTGSRIKRVDVFNRAPAANIGGIKKKSLSGKPMPRMRSQFMDAAYWNPDIVLAPGEIKKIKFKLPDNFTQWRVLVWGSDNSDGFSLTQTNFKTNLPIEVRAGLPGQLFVGDKTRAQISARNQSENAIAISMNTILAGGGVTLDKSNKTTVEAYDVLTQALDIKVTEPGSIDIATIADSSIGSDGPSTNGFVQSRMGHEKVTQSGWLDEEKLDLKIPRLPTSAIDTRLDLEVSRGFSRWTNGWLQDLQEYPHRCWEQTLSRAVGAAYADKYHDKSTWADRKETVNDALQVATSFKDEEGNYHYFQNERFEWTRKPNLVLSAYTLKSFHYLTTLGYEVQKEEITDLERLLGTSLDTVKNWQSEDKSLIQWEDLATIAGALENSDRIDPRTLVNIWTNWEKLSWFARSELVLAISRKPELKEQTQQGIKRLQEAGDRKGLRQIVGEQRNFSSYMASNLRDQCSVVGALTRLDGSAEGKPARERLLRGI